VAQRLLALAAGSGSTGSSASPTGAPCWPSTT